jgi:Ca2+-binding RTX toxin-like protein
MSKKKVAMVAAIVAVLLVLGASAVFADSGTTSEDGVSVIASNNQIVQCVKAPCHATGFDDLVYERVGNGKRDKILLSGGDDQVRADTYHRDRDIIKGGSGFDLIYVDDGDTKDKISGGKGDDKCFVDARSEVGGGCSRVIVR